MTWPYVVTHVAQWIAILMLSAAVARQQTTIDRLQATVEAQHRGRERR